MEMSLENDLDLTSIKSKVVFLTYLPPKNNKMQYFSELTSSPDFR